MVVEYTRYKIGESRRQDFIDAHRRATRHLHFRCIRYELSRCSDEREWFTLRIEWASSEELRRFHYDIAGDAFRHAINGFESDVQEHWHWEVMDVVHHSGELGRGAAEALRILPDHQPWNRLYPWMIEHLHEKILVDQMAEQVNMSPRNFARVFRREFGMPPGEFLDRVRVAAARNDLEEGLLSIEQIANARGFGSGSTMRRTFARVLGVAPSEYREGVLDGTEVETLVEASLPTPDYATLPFAITQPVQAGQARFS